jgi:hypothetical protein
VITLLLIYVVELLVLISPFYAERDHALTKEVREVENSRDGHQELAAKEKCISEERMKNCYLQRELDMLKQERTPETWLLKNDLRNLEKANSELQEQLKEQKRAHQGKPLSSFEYLPLTVFLGF